MLISFVLNKNISDDYNLYNGIFVYNISVMFMFYEIGFPLEH